MSARSVPARWSVWRAASWNVRNFISVSSGHDYALSDFLAIMVGSPDVMS